MEKAINAVLAIKSRIRYPKEYQRLWLTAARLCVLAYPEKRFIIDDVRAWAENEGLPPSTSNRIWGAITRALKAERRIKETGNVRKVTYMVTNSLKAKEWERIL